MASTTEVAISRFFKSVHERDKAEKDIKAKKAQIAKLQAEVDRVQSAIHAAKMTSVVIGNVPLGHSGQEYKYVTITNIFTGGHNSTNGRFAKVWGHARRGCAMVALCQYGHNFKHKPDPLLKEHVYSLALSTAEYTIWGPRDRPMTRYLFDDLLYCADVWVAKGKVIGVLEEFIELQERPD